MSKLLSQEAFKTGIKPQPGMIFYDEDDNMYLILDRHPNIRAGEAGIAFKQGDENTQENFWAVRQLTEREIRALLK